MSTLLKVCGITAAALIALTAIPAHAAPTQHVHGKWTAVPANYDGTIRVEAQCPKGTKPISVDVVFRGAAVKWNGNNLPRVQTTTQGFTGERSVYATSTIRAGKKPFRMRAGVDCR